MALQPWFLPLEISLAPRASEISPQFFAKCTGGHSYRQAKKRDIMASSMGVSPGYRQIIIAGNGKYQAAGAWKTWWDLGQWTRDFGWIWTGILLVGDSWVNGWPGGWDILSKCSYKRWFHGDSNQQHSGSEIHQLDVANYWFNHSGTSSCG